MSSVRWVAVEHLVGSPHDCWKVASSSSRNVKTKSLIDQGGIQKKPKETRSCI